MDGMQPPSIALATLAAALAAGAAALYGGCGIRLVPHRHVGAYVRCGRLVQHLDEPGLRFYNPFLTKTHNLFLGLDHDVVPPWDMEGLACRSLDGSLFRMRVDVLNRLDGEHALDTLNRFGIHYDQITIYDQVGPAVKKVCSKLSAHDLAIGRFDEVDDLVADKMRDAQKEILNSSVRIVQLKILDLHVPEVLATQFAAMAALKAEQLTHIERRKLNQENDTNKRLLLEASLERETWEAAVRRNLSLEQARGEAEVRKIGAEARKNERLSEAQADEAWLGNKERSRIELARLNPLGSLIGAVRVALWPEP